VVNPDLAITLDFVREIDKLKSILRQTLVMNKERRENTAEHSWHLATSVLVFEKFSNHPINLQRAMKMALIHDIVEIDAGDTFVYDAVGSLDKEVREKAAAIRLFGLLPKELGEELHNLWHEFEKQETSESKFVNAIDRFLPVLANYNTDGHAWKKHQIKKSQVIQKNEKISRGSEQLWALAIEMIDEAHKRGYLID
jgi:putative hydrolase of HD superfamily